MYATIRTIRKGKQMYEYFKNNIQPEVDKLDQLMINKELTDRENAREAKLTDQEVDEELTRLSCDHSALDDPDYRSCPDCGTSYAELVADDYETRADIERL